MTLGTNLHGRLRNTSLPISGGLLPLFEAVSNSIHAIEDALLPLGEGSISIEILRGQAAFDFDGASKRPGPEAKGEIREFVITDNGVGFTDANMRSFLTLDSEYKASRGGRGVGRLLWLKAFERALVESIYRTDEGPYHRRSFMFDERVGISNEHDEIATMADRHTVVKLSGFIERYREACPKTARVIARMLFEHCLWYFVRPGGAPMIEIIDESEKILLDEVYHEHMRAASKDERIMVKGTQFDLTHVKLSASSSRAHSIAFCAANRLVTQETIEGKIPGLFGSLHDDTGPFVYECYVSSPLLDERVRSERTSFDIEETPLEMFASNEVSQREIRESVIARATHFLDEHLREKRRLGNERVNSFVSGRAPRYRPILNRIPKERLAVDPEISDKDLDLFLHRQLAEIEGQLLSNGHDVMEPKDNESSSEYRRRLGDYLQVVEDLKKSDLANYVAHRRIILDLLEQAIQRRSDGRYEREELIHNLIMPMGTTSDDLVGDFNLWLVDERLAFHDYLASDKTLASMPFTDCSETKEPDILALSVFDNPVLVSDNTKLPLASIVIVELKRPMRNDASQGEDKDPIEQAMGYLERIRKGKVMTRLGRPIPQSEEIPGFCYAICDITPSIAKRCKILGLTPTHDHLGYFGYNANYKAYLEVMSFDRLVNAAKERNKAFFDKLGLPT